MTRSIAVRIGMLETLIQDAEAERLALIVQTGSLIRSGMDSSVAWQALRDIEDELATLQASQGYFRAIRQTPEHL